jgi:hypothetical protein
MTRFPRTDPTTRSKSRLPQFCLAITMATFAGCRESAQPPAAVAARADTSRSDSLLVLQLGDTAHAAEYLKRMKIMGPMIARFAADPITVNEYHDQQKFAKDDGSGYGPLASIFAVPYLAAYTSEKQFHAHGEIGLLVALVNVGEYGETLPTAYSGLRLEVGLHCVNLAHAKGQGPVKGWKAWVYRATDGVCERPASTAAAKELFVRATRANGSTKVEDYPVGARFGWDASGRPLLAVRCARAWCELGPTDFPNAEPAHNGDNTIPNGNGRAARVKGWHDEQKLAVLDGGKLVPRKLATIIPAEDLEDLDETAFETWRDVATIWFAEDPGPDYGPKKWGFRKGVNTLQMKYVGSGNWQAQVKGGDEPGELRVVPTRHWNAFVPGTARWNWKDDDESIWIRCAQGCCDVQLSELRR